MSTRTRWAGRFALLFAGLVFGGGLAESVARLRASEGFEGEWLLVSSPNWYDERIFQPDAELRQALRPGAVGYMRTPEFDTVVRVSSIGTRGADLGPKAADALRILAVGDSFTLAVQVDEDATFGAGLARRLTARLGRPVEVINAGVDGFGTFEAARQVGRLAPVVRADAILLNFFLGNDLEDNRGFRSEGYPLDVPRLPSLAGPVDRLFAGSYLYFHATAWVRAQQLALDPRATVRFRQEAAAFTRGADFGRILAPTRRALDELEQCSRALGIPLIVAVAPPAFTISPERARATFDLFGVSGEPDLDAPARAVLAALPLSFTAIDLSPALREAERGGRTYFVFDGHWTPRGHEFVAEALAPRVAERLLSRWAVGHRLTRCSRPLGRLQVRR
jgi:lysophospholipase L1-like esterase